MAFSLKLPRLLAQMRWKVKVRDRERVEDPHVTIIRGTKVWRVCLRDGRFMDGGSWNDMPNSLREVVERELGTVVRGLGWNVSAQPGPRKPG